MSGSVSDPTIFFLLLLAFPARMPIYIVAREREGKHPAMMYALFCEIYARCCWRTIIVVTIYENKKNETRKMFARTRLPLSPWFTRAYSIVSTLYMELFWCVSCRRREKEKEKSGQKNSERRSQIEHHQRLYISTFFFFFLLFLRVRQTFELRRIQW